VHVLDRVALEFLRAVADAAGALDAETEEVQEAREEGDAAELGGVEGSGLFAQICLVDGEVRWDGS
jgi:hypothetical protein